MQANFITLSLHRRTIDENQVAKSHFLTKVKQELSDYIEESHIAATPLEKNMLIWMKEETEEETIYVLSNN